MPSNKNPNQSGVVDVGPGRVPANSVDTASLTFAISGGDIQSHVGKQTDAHMASAIGIHEIYSATNEPLLASAGGPYDGESVEDALNAIKDLLPVKPDRIGFNNGNIPNSGVPSWFHYGAAYPGGSTVAVAPGYYTDATRGAVLSTNLVPSYSTGSYTITGIAYPADRGVLALYKTTSGNFFDSTPGVVTLVAALWLGSNPPPSGMASANFNSNTKNTFQGIAPSYGYTPTASPSTDIVTLTNRFPYLQNYADSTYNSAYSNYSTNFFSYQIATYSIPVTISNGDNGSYMLVHWREGFFSGTDTVAKIAPITGLTSLTLSTGNCYSAVTSDSSDFPNVRRMDVFVDQFSGSGPTASTFTSSPTGTVTTTDISGVHYYNSTSLTFSITNATCSNLFRNTYYDPPVTMDVSAFGGSNTSYGLFSGGHVLDNAAGNPAFTTTGHPPQTTSVALFTHISAPIGGAANGVPDFRNPSLTAKRLSLVWTNPFGITSAGVDNTQYMYLPLSQFSAWTSGSPVGKLPTQTTEGFLSESYRYDRSFSINLSARIQPSGAGVLYDSSALISGPDLSHTGDLQVLSAKLVYPQDNFTLSTVKPSQTANYSALGDVVYDGTNASTATRRMYIRALNTTNSTSGFIKLSGISALSVFQASVTPVDDFADHTGGVMIHIRPNTSSNWYDLGRNSGNVDGCLNGAVTFSGGELCVPYLFPSTGPYATSGTADNGFGEKPLFIRVTFLPSSSGGRTDGRTLNLTGIRWTASLGG